MLRQNTKYDTRRRHTPPAKNYRTSYHTVASALFDPFPLTAAGCRVNWQTLLRLATQKLAPSGTDRQTQPKREKTRHNRKRYGITSHTRKAQRTVTSPQQRHDIARTGHIRIDTDRLVERTVLTAGIVGDGNRPLLGRA